MNTHARLQVQVKSALAVHVHMFDVNAFIAMRVHRITGAYADHIHVSPVSFIYFCFSFINSVCPVCVYIKFYRPCCSLPFDESRSGNMITARFSVVSDVMSQSERCATKQSSPTTIKKNININQKSPLRRKQYLSVTANSKFTL